MFWKPDTVPSFLRDRTAPLPEVYYTRVEKASHTTPSFRFPLLDAEEVVTDTEVTGDPTARNGVPLRTIHTRCPSRQARDSCTSTRLLDASRAHWHRGLMGIDKRPEILWDTWGVPHIYAADERAAAFGCGWAQMRAHGDLIALLYAQARGRAAEVYGEQFLESDRRTRTVGVPALGVRWTAAISSRMRAICEDFAAGANAYAAERSFDLDVLSRDVFPITATDVVSHSIRLLFFGWICPEAMLDAQTETWERQNSVPGSNAWAIGPAASASGNTILMGNPHMPWADMYLAFEQHVVLPERWTYGAAILGLPSFAFGFNEYLGWTHTVNTYRGYTLYELELDRDGYLLDGERRAFSDHTERIKVRQSDGSYAEHTLAVRRSAHGPVIRSTRESALALRIAGLDRPGALEVWGDFARARSLEQFDAVLRRMELPGFNVVYADRDGNIMEFFGGLPPVRSEGDFEFWSAPVPGDRGELIWRRYHAYDDMPRAVNPASGWLASSNEPPWYMSEPYPLSSRNYPAYIAPPRPHPTNVFRFQANHRLVTERLPISFETLIELRNDDHGEAARRLVSDLIVAARASNRPVAHDAARVLAEWDLRYEPESRGAFLFSRWYGLYTAEMELSGVDPFARPWSDTAPALTVPSGLADPGAAVGALVAAAGSMLDLGMRLDARWGDVVRMRAGEFDLPARGGPGFDTVRVLAPAEPSSGGKTVPVIQGDSFVFAVEFGAPVRARVLLTYGNAGKPGNPHCGDQLELYARNEMRDALLTREQVEASLELTE